MHTSTGPSITITGLNEDTDYWIDVRRRIVRETANIPGDLATSTLAGTGTTVSANAGSDVSVESDGSVGIGGVDTITNPVGTTTYLWSRQSGTAGLVIDDDREPNLQRSDGHLGSRHRLAENHDEQRGE